ncbi:MAG: ABC-F family ATP-binding cassette domain-containing protein [Anaerolineales bacterium]|nr:ABC-F family ATP-binding cassette domain-containing protein [Anaerolineales bacterium]
MTVSYNATPVFQNLSWEIHNDRCVGLVGPNGAGKSSLLKLISGELTTESGFANPRGAPSIGYLHQEPQLDPGRTVIAEALTASARLPELQARLAKVEAEMGQPEVYSNENKLARKIEEQAQLLDEFTRIGGPGYAGQVRATLLSLGFEEHELDLPVSALSGGQKKLVGLAKLLVTKPDLLLLDEPDNHLDMAGKEFLEKYIRNYPGGVVIVSHDRYLLDLVADEIADLEEGRITVYPGNYSEYAAEKETRRMHQQHHFDVQQREVQRLEMSAKRMLHWGRSHENEKLIRRAKSMMKRIEKMEKVEKPTAERKDMGLQLSGWRGSNKVLEISGLRKAFDIPGEEVRNEVLAGIDLTLWHGERVGLVGPNGAGKSLVFRLLLGREQPDAGEIKLGPSIQHAYYSQEHETLDDSASLLSTVRRAGNLNEPNAVNLLARFLYGYQQLHNRVDTLSGGERSRLQLLLIMLSGANFLLLDEPTNNLDIRSAEVLEDVLADFEGSVLMISHDRYFLDRVAGRIVELQDGKLVEYPGGYSDYQAAKARLAA